MRRRMLSAATAAALGLALAVSVAPRASAADACTVLDFDTAAVTQVAAPPGSRPPVRNRLTVTGTKPATNVYVRLAPVKHVAQVDYWGILVSGCTSGAGLPVLTPYTATYDVDWSMGSCGIEVIGATRSQKFDLVGCRPIPLDGTRWVLDPASLGVPVPAATPITADFSDRTMSGSTSCNEYRADYKVGADGAFAASPILLTKRGCDAQTGPAESAFVARLARATQVRATTTQLQLRADGQIVLRFTPAAPAA